MLHRHAAQDKPEVADEGGGSTLLKAGLAVVAVGAAAGVAYTVVTRKKAAAARDRSGYESDDVVPLRAVDEVKQAASEAGEKAKEAAGTVAEKVKGAAAAATGSAEAAAEPAASSMEEHHDFQSDLDHVAHQIADSFVEDIELPDGPLPE